MPNVEILAYRMLNTPLIWVYMCWLRAGPKQSLWPFAGKVGHPYRKTYRDI
jgi:hypothetical protein